MDKPIINRIKENEKILVGIGEEWLRYTDSERMGAYNRLAGSLSGKDYFIVTLLTDGMILNSELDQERIVAPCGNELWMQCPDACTKDIWEPDEIEDGRCPHCQKRMIGNTIYADHYIEEGYLIKWRDYTKWLSLTLNKTLLVLELGVGFKIPSVIRWPFEKTVFFNKKAFLYRISNEWYHTSDEIKDKSIGIQMDPVAFIEGL